MSFFYGMKTCFCFEILTLYPSPYTDLCNLMYLPMYISPFNFMLFPMYFPTCSLALLPMNFSPHALFLVYSLMLFLKNLIGNWLSCPPNIARPLNLMAISEIITGSRIAIPTLFVLTCRSKEALHIRATTYFTTAILLMSFTYA